MKITGMPKIEKNNLQLIGLVARTNGALLSETSPVIERIGLVVKGYKTVNIHEIEEKGLSKSSIGSVILFR